MFLETIERCSLAGLPVGLADIEDFEVHGVLPLDGTCNLCIIQAVFLAVVAQQPSQLALLVKARTFWKI